MSDPNDKLLDDYLRRESAVSQRYRELEADDIPPQVDAAVLAQARAAVEQQQARKPSWVRWGAPLALAASAVMVVAVVLEVGVQDEVRAPAAQLERAASTERTPEAYVVEQMIQEAPPAAPMAPAAQSQPTMTIGEPVAVEARAREPSSPLDSQPTFAKSSESQAADSVVSERLESTRAQAQARTRTLANARAAQDDTAMLERERASKRASAQAMATTTAASRPPAVTTQTSSAVPAVSAPTAGPRLEPQLWLEQIRELRRQGKALEADEQWREFVKAYPQFEISATDSARPKP